MKKIFLDYIRAMYYYLEIMSDDEIDDFYINNEACRSKLFEAMKADFDRFGPVSKQRVLDAVEFILSSDDIEGHWWYVVPQEVPLDEVEDKHDFLCALYHKLAGHEPSRKRFGSDVELVDAVESHDLDVRQ